MQVRVLPGTLLRKRYALVFITEVGMFIALVGRYLLTVLVVVLIKRFALSNS